MKVLAFAASNSRNSINKAVVSYAADLLKAGIVDHAEVEIIDLREYEMPLFSIDRQQEEGIPELAQQFYKKIGEADALVISFAEHNGYYTAAFKNLFDWTSRIDRKVYQGKPAVLLAASPGPGGGSRVLAVAKTAAPHFAMEVKADLSIPHFHEQFDLANGRVSNRDLQAKLASALATLN